MNAAAVGDLTADLERRFGGLRRLHGDAGYARLRQARVAVVGLGGVGSWAVEALARSGVAALVLIDMDQVAESNINRQVQALSSTLGQSKAEALRQRIHDIHPGCDVITVEDFVEPDNWPALLPAEVDAVIDARRKTIPAQRFGNPQEFGAICAFLCSQQASYITGQNVLADGGAYPGTY